MKGRSKLYYDLVSPLTIFISHSSEVLTDHTPHGDGFVAYSVVKRLAERGHRVHVAAQKVDLIYPVHPNMIVHLIDTRTDNVPLHRVRFAWRARRLLKQLMKTEKIDIIHQLNPVFVGLSLGLVGIPIPVVLGSYAARWPNDPGSIASGGGVSKRALEFLRDTLANQQQQRAAAILLSSPAAINQIPKAKSLADRIHIWPYGVDTDMFFPGEGEREQPEPKDILFLATTNRRKGIYDLLKAFERVAVAVPNCVLRIAGDGPELENVKRAVAQSNEASRIEFLPYQARAATVVLHRACSLFCSPSHGEPFGMAVLEAMACGAPVVVTREGGHGYTVSPEAGILVPMHDSDKLAEALIRMLQDDDGRRKMGLFAQRWAKEHFSWDVVIPQVEQIYAQVLGIEKAA